jgi:WXXGXW repeat (2 copies)
MFHSPLTLRIVTLAAPAAALTALGCGGPSIPHPHYAAQTASAYVAIVHEPPPARVEDLPPRPAGASVWVDGEWTWNRRRWVWHPGRWVAPPAGATYARWETVRDTAGTLYFAPAQWHDASGAPIAAPKALATAKTESGAVVDAEGDMERTTVGGDED